MATVGACGREGRERRTGRGQQRATCREEEKAYVLVTLRARSQARRRKERGERRER